MTLCHTKHAGPGRTLHVHCGICQSEPITATEVPVTLILGSHLGLQMAICLGPFADRYRSCQLCESSWAFPPGCKVAAAAPNILPTFKVRSQEDKVSADYSIHQITWICRKVQLFCGQRGIKKNKICFYSSPYSVHTCIMPILKHISAASVYQLNSLHNSGRKLSRTRTESNPTVRFSVELYGEI